MSYPAPQGLYDDCVPSDPACLAHLDRFGAAGFRLVLNYGQFYASAPDLIAYADRANRAGLRHQGVRPGWWRYATDYVR